MSSPRQMPGRPPPVKDLYMVTPHPESKVTEIETTLAKLADGESCCGGRPTRNELSAGYCNKKLKGGRHFPTDGRPPLILEQVAHPPDPLRTQGSSVPSELSPCPARYPRMLWRRVACQAKAVYNACRKLLAGGRLIFGRVCFGCAVRASDGGPPVYWLRRVLALRRAGSFSPSIIW
jgi:hypothetical protein